MLRGGTVKVSVIIPTFDSADLLPRALASVASQSHRDVEVIVVDDGSNDETDRTVHQISASYPFLVRYFRQPHGGGAAARNRGALAAGGDALAFLDSVDEWSEYSLARLVDALDTTGADFAYGPATHLDESGDETVVSPAATDHLEDLAESLFERPRLRSGATLLRRRAFDAVGGFDESLQFAEMCDFHQRLAVRCRGAFVDAPIVRVFQPHDRKPMDRAAFFHGLLASAEKLLAQEPAFAQRLGPRADERVEEIRERLLHCLILGGEMRAAQRLAHRMAPLRDRSQRVALALGSAWPYSLALRWRAARRRWAQARESE
jgi:glycosyltransferase involved in cell wall biosynthesis